jgi:hypothetical protein
MLGAFGQPRPQKLKVKNLSKKEDDGMPTIISVDEVADKAAKKIEEKMKPAPKPDSLTEPTEKEFNYKEKAAAMVRDKNCNWVWTGNPATREQDLKYFEAIGAVTATDAVPEVWAADVFRCCPYPASAFWDAPFIKWHEDIHGKPGDTIYVVTVGRATCGTMICEEPDSTAATIGKGTISLEEYQCSHYICRDDLEDVVEDTITELNENLMTCLDTCIDNAFIANILGHGSTLNKGAGTMTANTIAEAIGSMRNGTCEPVALIIHPVVEASLLQDSQFVNAATFGDRSVITGGHIIQYLGLDILVVPKGSLHIGTGTYGSLMLARYAVHAARKRDPILEQQYLVQTQRKYVIASVRFGKTVVCEDGVWWILTAK